MASKKEKAVYEVIINGELAGKTLKELEGSLRSVRAQFKLATDPAEHQRLAKAYQNINGKIQDQNNLLKGTGGMWSKIGKEVKQFGMIAAGYLGFQFLFSEVKNLIQGNAKFSDSLANVRKTTGLTQEGVMQLNRELKKIDTRTSRSELLKLAVDAGKLGKESVEDIKKFVKEADMIKVALGEDLGDDAVIKIAKLSKIFKTEMLNIASAINTVGQKSEASEQFQVDFLARIAGISQTAKLGAADMLGYSAALEIQGQTAEVSGTAINKFMIDFIKNANEFGMVAGMADGELTKLITDKGTNTGFIEFLTKLKEGSTSSQDMLIKLQKLGVDGSRGANVLLSLANNIGLVKDQQLIANKAFTEGNSVLQEFNTKNDTFGAVLDKLGKKIGAWFVSSNAVKGLENIFRSFYDLTLDKGEELVKQWDEQKKRVESLEKTYVPLIDRYEELAFKGKLNVSEQTELNEIVKKVSQTIPEAISQFDEYGKAMAINSVLARQFIETQRLIGEQKHADALKEQRAELFDLKKDLENTQAQLGRRNDKGQVVSTKTVQRKNSSGELESISSEVALTGNEISKLVQKITDIQNKIAGSKGVINELLGDPDYYKTSLDSLQTLTKENVDSILDSNTKLTDDDKKKINKVLENNRKLYEGLQRLRADAIKEDVTRDIALANAKYENERDRISKEVADQKVKNEVLEQLEINHAQEIEKIKKDAFSKQVNSELAQDLKNLETWYNSEKLLLKTAYADKKITKEQFELQSNKLDLQNLSLKLKNLKDYNQDTTDVESEYQELRIKIQENGWSDLEKLYKDKSKQLSGEQKKQAQALLADLAVAIVSGVSATGQSVEEIIAQLEELLNSDSWQKRLKKLIGHVTDFAAEVSGIWSSINKIAENNDKKRLAKFEKNLEKEKKAYDKLLKKKYISQSEYDKKIVGLEEEQDKRARKMARDNAIRQKKVAIFSAVVSTATAVAGQLAQQPVGVWNIALAALMAIAGGLQIAAISNEPLPELGKGKRFGGIGKHPNSRKKVIDSNGDAYYVEDNETLLSAATRDQNPELVDALLQASQNNDGRLNSSLKLPYIRDEYPQVNTGRILETTRIFQNRGQDPIGPLGGRKILNADAAQDAHAIINRDGPQDAKAIVNHPALAKMEALIEKQNTFLERLLRDGVDSKLAYDRFKKDYERLEKITGGKVY